VRCIIVADYIQVFPISPRLPASTVFHLLGDVSAHHLIMTSASLASFIVELREIATKADYVINIEELPGLPETYPRLAREVASDPFVSLELPSGNAFPGGVEIYLHSSGSNGAPKSIPFSHKYLYTLQHSGTLSLSDSSMATVLIHFSVLH
jgi:acyl-CoA synthetase (AMP-forming)/AMP-acid ligase II